MFTLSEIKEIRKKYKLDENGQIKLTGREQAKDVSQLTEEEKSDISCAIFLNYVFGSYVDEEFLKQAQTQFITQVLNSNEYNIGLGAIGNCQREKEPCYGIWKGIIHEEKGAMTYFNRVLAENGKRIQMLQRNDLQPLIVGIKYSLMEDSKSKFRQSLNPNNPIYTQNPETKVLTLEQKQNRRKFVDKLMQVYRQYEKDENYDNRVKTEENDMYVISDMNSKHGRIEVLAQTSKSTARVMNLLYAAQNLSLDGQKDYVEALIDQPQINEFLLNLRRHDFIDIMEKSIQERKDNGMLSEHKPTHFEIARTEANKLISVNPNAVGMAKKILNENHKYFKINKGNIENLRKAYLIEIVGLTLGKYVARSTDPEGNKILQVDDKEITR